MLYRLSYMSGLRTAMTTPKDRARHKSLSVDEFTVLGNPLLTALGFLDAGATTASYISHRRSSVLTICPAAEGGSTKARP